MLIDTIIIQFQTKIFEVSGCVLGTTHSLSMNGLLCGAELRDQLRHFLSCLTFLNHSLPRKFLVKRKISPGESILTRAELRKCGCRRFTFRQLSCVLIIQFHWPLLVGFVFDFTEDQFWGLSRQQRQRLIRVADQARNLFVHAAPTWSLPSIKQEKFHRLCKFVPEIASEAWQ